MTKFKILTITTAIIISIFLWSKYWYDAGKDKILQSNYVTDLEESIRGLETDLESAESTKEVVVKYKDKIVEIEKEIPIYVERIEEIFAYDDDIIIPDKLKWLHDEIIQNGSEVSETASRIDGPTVRPRNDREVTLGEFSNVVIKNYGRCIKNSEQLRSLIEWADEQDRIINKR